MPKTISPTRIRDLNQAPPKQPEGEYVLYWMIAARRSRWNFALQHAVHLAAELNVGLLVFEPPALRLSLCLRPLSSLHPGGGDARQP